MCGLLFYVGVIVLLGFAGSFVLSAYAHARLPAGDACRLGVADARCSHGTVQDAKARVLAAPPGGRAGGKTNETTSP